MLVVVVVVLSLVELEGRVETVVVEKAVTLTQLERLVLMDWVVEEVGEHTGTLTEGMAGLVSLLFVT
jgi:hypothetical protein